MAVAEENRLYHKVKMAIRQEFIPEGDKVDGLDKWIGCLRDDLVDAVVCRFAVERAQV